MNFRFDSKITNFSFVLEINTKKEIILT